MPDWNQLVEHTAECALGPFILAERREGSARVFDILSVPTGGNPVVIATIPDTSAGRVIQTEGGPEYFDPVQEASARLLMDAWSMLKLLARVATVSEGQENDKALADWAQSPLWCEVRRMLCRHVRLGCAPADSYNRAEFNIQQSADKATLASDTTGEGV